MSAQTNDPYFIVFCYSVLKCNLNASDNRGRTPLHLAALDGKEGPIGPLLALTHNTNETDNDGMTPLHYAVMSESYSITRMLLMRGSNRLATDIRGKKPFHLAKLKKNKRISELLREQHCLSEFNPLSHPLKPVKHRRLLFSFYHCIMLSWYILVILFILPGLNIWVTLASLLLLLANLCMFEVVARLDPGFRTNPDKDLMQLYNKYSSQHVCAFCRAKKGHRDVHCVYCNRCVKGFDHHCPWINNCVGVGNQRFFIWFLVVKQITYIFHCSLGLLDYEGLISHSDPLYGDPLKSHAQLGNQIGLAVSIICAICSLAVAPCLCTQVKRHRNIGLVTASNLSSDGQSDTQSMFAQVNISEDLLFTPRSSAPSESLIRVRVEEVYSDSGCFGLCKHMEFNFKFEHDADERSYDLVLNV